MLQVQGVEAGLRRELGGAAGQRAACQEAEEKAKTLFSVLFVELN